MIMMMRMLMIAIGSYHERNGELVYISQIHIHYLYNYSTGSYFCHTYMKLLCKYVTQLINLC